MGVYRRGDRKNGAWWVRFKDETGTIRRLRVGPDRQAALEVLRLKQAEVVERKFLPHRELGKMRLADFVDRYLTDVAAALRSRVGIEHSLRQWIAHLGNVRLCEIKKQAIEQYRTRRLKDLSPASCNRLLAHLRAALNVAVEWDLLAANPAARVKPLQENNQRLRFLSEKEARDLVDAVSPPVRLFIVLALNLGCRRGELLSLRWRDINWTAGTVTFVRTKQGKRHEVPMNATVRAALTAAPRTKDVVVTASLSTIRRQFEKACAELGLVDWRIHDLRHAAASALVQAGVELAVVREILGHASIQTTMRYAHLAPGAASRAVERINLGARGQVRDGVVIYRRKRFARARRTA